MIRKRFSIGPVEFRINWIVALCVVFTIFGLTRLGLWQLSRAEEKIQQQNDYQAMVDDAPTAIDNIPLAGRQYDLIQLQNRRVSMQGHYLNERSIFLVYQSYEDQIGYEIITPFVADSTDEVVLVSRGWTGAASYEEVRDNLPDIEGEQEVQGQIFVSSEAMAAHGDSPDSIQWPLMMRYLNIDALAPHFDRPLFPYVVRLAEGQPGVLVRYWPTVMVDTTQHFSYALQWFSMAIAVLIISLLLSSNLMALFREKAGPL